MSRNKKLSPHKRTQHEPLESPSKRMKALILSEEEKAKNFTIACKQVSNRNYFDYHERFQLVYLPACVKMSCNHSRNAGNVVEMPNFAQSSFASQISNNTWYPALEVCRMCLTPTQYLSSYVLQEIIEIMLNVYEDEFSEYSAKHIINNCQQILLQNFSTHPPCVNNNLRNCYINFLTSSMPDKKQTSTDRGLYQYEKGIVKYCLNRLEYELSANSKDDPLVKKYIPENFRDIKSVHLNKKKFEIYESLNREQRIERLFAVLETILELLQFDLAIDLSRSSNNHSLGLRSNKLMKHVLEIEVGSKKVVTTICQQILRIFTQIIHLQYPDHMVKIITAWLNITVQTIYSYESFSNINYPQLSEKCATVGYAIFEFIVDLPHDSIIRILQAIKPIFMTHVVGLFYINKILSTDFGCIFKILEYFLKQVQWELYSSNDTKLKCSEVLTTKNTNNKLQYLLNTFMTPVTDSVNGQYAKMEQNRRLQNMKVSLNHIAHALYITLNAYLEATNLQHVHDTWIKLNRNMMKEDTLSEQSAYSVTFELTNKYESDLNDIEELSRLFIDLKKRRKLPQEFRIFQNIKILHLRL